MIKQRMLPLLERLGAVAFGLTLAWLMIEVLLRAAYPMLPAFAQWALRDLRVSPFGESTLLPVLIWQQDPTYGVISRPNHREELYVLSTNGALPVITENWLDPASQVGFRVPAPGWQPQQPVDTVIVGDSFSFCYTPYEDCWTSHLAASMDWSIANLGMVSTGSISHQRILRDFGMQMQPDLVIWQWFGNDFSDDYWLTTGDGGALATNQITAFGCTHDSPAQKWLHEHSGVYTLVMTVVCVRNIGFSTAYHIDDGALQMGYGDPYILNTLDMATPRSIEGLRLTQQAVLDARKMLDASGTRLLIVLIPTKEEVYRQWTQAKLGAGQIDALGEGRRQMLAFCEAERLTCFDATHALTKAAEAGEQLYWGEDLHLNERGNAVLAEALRVFMLLR